MPYVERDNLFLTVLNVCQTYTGHRHLNVIFYDCYRLLRTKYAKALGQNQGISDAEPLVFPDEPCRMAAAMDIRLPHPPDYLICCYDSYQLTNHISAAMYVQYSLGLKQTQSFAIADMGALSPLLALEWVRLTRSEAMLVCMEQVYDRMESWEGTRFPRADALAMLSVSSRQGTYRVIAYEQQEVSFHPWEPAADERLAAASCQLIDNQLVDLSLDPDDVTVVVHSYSDLYLRLVSHHYPHVCCRADRRNLGTADCFYTLHELAGEETKRPFLLFVLADRRGGVGLLLVRCLTSMVEKGGTL